MFFPVDPHTHTLASGHAYNTIHEMAAAANKKNISLLGITEHGPKTNGSCVPYYFQNLHLLSRQFSKVELLLGAEVSLLDYEANMDLSDAILSEMDIVIASIHNETSFGPLNADMHTAVILKAIAHPHVNIIGHPDDGRYPLHYDAVVRAAKEGNVLLELNNSSLNEKSWREHARENCLEILSLSKTYGVPVCLSSDAHNASDIGNFERLKPLLHQTEFPAELIANTTKKKFKKLLARKKR